MESFQTSDGRTIKNIFIGVGISFLISVVLLLIFSLILTYTDISEETINPVIIVVTAISILIGSTIGSVKIRKNGIVNGGIIGGTYIVILYLISSFLNWNFGLNWQSLIMIIIGIIFGVIGGIVGVNRR